MSRLAELQGTAAGHLLSLSLRPLTSRGSTSTPLTSPDVCARPQRVACAQSTFDTFVQSILLAFLIHVIVQFRYLETKSDGLNSLPQV